MDKTKALQNLLNGTAAEDASLFKRLLASGKISIDGNAHRWAAIIALWISLMTILAVFLYLVLALGYN